VGLVEMPYRDLALRIVRDKNINPPEYYIINNHGTFKPIALLGLSSSCKIYTSRRQVLGKLSGFFTQPRARDDILLGKLQVSIK
jgi:hypothetical protein